ncbi:MAG: DNA mismatch repair protein MutS [Planctomycetaceae bacterium]|nr:DNA mismatch repair protein MutS [Planctomycetaceae bacterium]
MNTPAATTASPEAEYQQRFEQRSRSAKRYSLLDSALSITRGATFLSTVAVVLFVFSPSEINPWWIALPSSLFLILVVTHASVSKRRDRYRRAVEFYERGIQRLEHKWSSTGATGDRYKSPEHMYSGDLDIFGEGSLFQLICRARTRLGEDRLAEWLMDATDSETIRRRQQSVEELRYRLDFREQFALLDAEVHEDLNQNLLIEWSQQPPRLLSKTQQITAAIFGILAVLAVLAWTPFGFGPSPLVVVLIFESIFLFTHRKLIQDVRLQAEEANSGLTILSQVLGVLEAESFHSTNLKEVSNVFESTGTIPSKRIRQLQNRIQNLVAGLQNQFFAPFALILCVPIHLVHAIESWKARFGDSIPQWLDAVGEVEATASLSGYAYENPNDPFPKIRDDGLEIIAEELGHPLILPSECVRNDIRIGEDQRLVLISGSNMSGKSTLMRTVGINMVLALAGAPVRATAMTVSPVTIGSEMRVQDSLQAGASLFYTVISRIKSIVELTSGKRPLLFLLDEILQGTNSHDRRVGAEAIIRSLLDQGAVGLVTTHDLALTKIVDSIGDTAINVHFEDNIVDGEMTFDYRMRPGVIDRSNALELMRMIGLKIEKRGNDQAPS